MLSSWRTCLPTKSSDGRRGKNESGESQVAPFELFPKGMTLLQGPCPCSSVTSQRNRPLTPSYRQWRDTQMMGQVNGRDARNFRIALSLSSSWFTGVRMLGVNHVGLCGWWDHGMKKPRTLRTSTWQECSSTLPYILLLCLVWSQLPQPVPHLHETPVSGELP